MLKRNVYLIIVVAHLLTACGSNNPTTEPPNHPTRTFTHPALPFYLLAYALSVSMIVISQHTPITFTVALVAGAIVYFGSAALRYPHRPYRHTAAACRHPHGADA